MEVALRYQLLTLLESSAQCAVCAVRQPCGQNSPMSATLIPEVGTRPYYAVCQFRVWNSWFPRKSCFPSNRTSWDKCKLNGISRDEFEDMSQLVRLEEKYCTFLQCKHCFYCFHCLLFTLLTLLTLKKGFKKQNGNF